MSIVESERVLVEAAALARQHAYAPYSKFRVGAAVRLADGRVFTGVNVENASYGLTVCAERNALAAAVAAGARPGEVSAVAVAAESLHLTTPCGACRQVIAELAAAGVRVLLHNLADFSTEALSLADLLPRAFGPSNMPRA